MQVGLIDGPGNPIAAYHAAVLALATLIKRGRALVYCHTGGRSLAVAVMYLNCSAHWRKWEDWMQLLNERIEVDLPVPHDAHRAAFDKINWDNLAAAAMED